MCGPWSLLAQFPAPLAGLVLGSMRVPACLAQFPAPLAGSVLGGTCIPARLAQFLAPLGGTVLARMRILSPSGD
ncbi:hypothetical protein [Streptomyces sp. NPDC048111]|uniref:hypothetical protein n=1 Tax=Streptomyces sp. NPDC048111 TaxID=3365500 RepID=UPI00372191A1